LTSPTPAQLPAVAVSSGHIVYNDAFEQKKGIDVQMGIIGIKKNLKKWIFSTKNWAIVPFHLGQIVCSANFRKFLLCMYETTGLSNTICPADTATNPNLS
jgi:hypothetical protein